MLNIFFRQWCLLCMSPVPFTIRVRIVRKLIFKTLTKNEEAEVPKPNKSLPVTPTYYLTLQKGVFRKLRSVSCCK